MTSLFYFFAFQDTYTSSLIIILLLPIIYQMPRTLGKIIFYKNSFICYALRVTILLKIAFHSD